MCIATHTYRFTHIHTASQYTMRPVRSSVLCRLLPAPISLALRSLVMVLVCINRKSCSHARTHMYACIKKRCSIDSRGKLRCHYPPNKGRQQLTMLSCIRSFCMIVRMWQFSVTTSSLFSEIEVPVDKPLNAAMGCFFHIKKKEKKKNMLVICVKRLCVVQHIIKGDSSCKNKRFRWIVQNACN